MHFAAMSPKWYLNLSIQRKLLLSFVPLMLITISFTGFLSYRIAANEIASKMQVEQASMAKSVMDHLDYITQDAIHISDYLYLSPDIQALLSSRTPSGGYVSNTGLFNSISRLMVTRPYFQFLTIYSEHFPPIQFNNKGLSSAIPFEEYRTAYHYDALLKEDQTERWSIETPEQKNTIFRGDSLNKLLMTKVLKNDVSLKPEGVLILGMDEKEIRRIYDPGGEDATVVIVNADGSILSDSRGRWAGQNVRQLPFFKEKLQSVHQIDTSVDHDQWIFTRSRNPVSGWQVLVFQPKADLLQRLSRIQWLTALVLLVTLLLSIPASWFLGRVITRPLSRLLTSMGKLQQGDFTQKVNTEGLDEIGRLGQGYNVMVHKIRELIDEGYSSEIRRQDAELKLLQSQINPHFLYNTLNTIAWTAQKNGDDQVADMIYSLSSIFKISLNQGNDMIELHKEMELAEHYLFLQQMRFARRLTYELDVAPEARDILIPKLIVQPLIENAIVHGIEPLPSEEGMILIRASLLPGKPEWLEIEVTDNGVGMPEPKLAEITERLQSTPVLGPGTSDSFALVNIMNRIRLIFGNEAKLNIHSVENSGTRATLRLPIPRR